MGNKTIKSLIISLVFILTFSTSVFAESMDMGKGIEQKVDGISVELSFKDEKVKTGKEDIMITLHDSNDKAIEDATVTATAEMDKDMTMDMKSSEPIAIELKSSDEKGQYMGTVNFTDKGKWIVDTTINVSGEKKNVKFEVDVVSGGPNWGIIGGFLGVIVLIIVVAAVKKKQAVKA